MNPIHESGFASLFVLLLASCPGGLATLSALILCWKYPRKAATAANVAIVSSALVCVLAAITTMRLHSRVDYWIDTGGYGPPAAIRAEYGALWHESARFTAWVGLFFTSLPFVVSVIVHQVVRRKDRDLEQPIAVFALGAVALCFCVIMAIL